MKYNHKLNYLLIFIALLLFLSVVSAHESTNDTTEIIKPDQIKSSDIIKEDNQISTTKEEDTYSRNITKNTNTIVKTANKKPTYFDIKIRNNIVDNSTIEVGVIDAYTSKAIPNSKLNITLPNKSTINAITQKSGYVNVTMKLPYGKNTVKIEYPATNDYYSYDYDLNINVSKRNASMQLNIQKSNSTGDVNLTIKLADSIYANNINNAKTSIKLSDGRTFEKTTDTKGEAKYSFKLSSGKQTINITYPGDSKYNSIKTNVTLDMGKFKNNVDYDVRLNNLYVGKTSLSVTLKDAVTHKTLSNTQLKLKLSNGKTYTGKTDKNGVLTTNVDAPVGKNYMDIIYDGNTTYNNRTSKINFTVKKRVSDMNLSVPDYNNPQLTIQLKDLVLNKSISNAPITITLPNGQKVNKNTNSAGQVSYPITVQEGTSKTYKVTYNGNSNITNITKSLTVKKDKAKIPVTFNVTVKNRTYQNDSVTFTMIDTKTNKTIAQAPISIQLPQKTVSAKTDNKGQVTLKTNMTPGTNRVTIKYNGNDKYQNRTATVNITISKRPSTINAFIKATDVLKLNLALTDLITNKSIANAKLILKHPKKNVTLTTDANGKINEDIILPSGKAEISIAFPGNDIYYGSQVYPTNISLSPLVELPTKVTLNPVTGFMGDKVTLTANVLDIKGNPINMGNVIFKLNGKTLKTDNVFGSNQATKLLSVRNGKASVTLTADKVLRNANNITATYTGNSKYYKNQSAPVTPKINMKKASITVTTSPKIQQQYQYITFKVNVKDITNKANSTLTDHKDSYVFFKINDKTLKDSKSKVIKVKVTNSTATYQYQVPQGMAGINKDKSVRNYIVTAVYYNPYYSAVKNTTTFNVNKSTTKIEMSTVQYSNKTRTLKLVGNIKDYKNNNVIGNSVLNIKINGKTVPYSNKTVNYVIKEGKINLTINVPSTFGKIKSITLKCGDRLAYINSHYETKTIQQV